jgi:hypothetical protein
MKFEGGKNMPVSSFLWPISKLDFKGNVFEALIIIHLPMGIKIAF